VTEHGSRTADPSPAPALPPVVDRAAFQDRLERLRVREKAHTREGDAIAAARRRLPMVEVAADLELTGPGGPVTLLDAFEGRRQLIAYCFMWHDGHDATGQCEGCTGVTTQVQELSCLHSRDITRARTGRAAATGTSRAGGRRGTRPCRRRTHSWPVAASA
jgi:predicted dithiol-disulfide oxidoreductase (DUF899 family)